MGFSQPTTLTLPASTALPVILFRQACWPAWATMLHTVLAGVSYVCAYDQGGTVASAESSVSVRGVYEIWGNGSYTAATPATTFTPSITTTLPNTYVPMGKDSGLGAVDWTYIPGGSFAYVSVLGSSAWAQSQTVVVELEVWSAPSEVNLNSGSPPVAVSLTGLTAISAGKCGAMSTAITIGGLGKWVRPKSASFSSAVAGLSPTQVYIALLYSSTAVTYTPSAIDQGAFTAPAGALELFLPLLTPAEFGNSKLPWYATRTTAAAMLGTNVSQVLNKGGTVIGGRVSPNVLSAWDLTVGYLNRLHPAEKAFLPLESGVYTYCPPSTDMQNFWDYTMQPLGSGLTSSPLFRLDNDALYNGMYITAGSVAESLAVTVDWHIEFRTSSALFQIGLSTMPLEALHTAQLSLAHAGFFFENWTHKEVLRKISAAVKKFGPSLVSAVNPAVGRMLQSVTSAISANPTLTNKMKPTSGTASGLVGKVPPKIKASKKAKANVRKKKGKGK